MGRQRLLPLALLGAALWSIPAKAAGPAQPGTVNYVEGRVMVDGRPVTSHDLGNVAALDGSVVATRKGKAEILLTPGVLLRIGDTSQVRMDSELLTNTRVTLLSGEAMVEADQVYPENHIAIAQGSAITTVLKKGLYEFSAVGPSTTVVNGEAMVNVGGHSVKLKDQHQLILTDARLKPHKIDRATQDELYAWSRLRSEYEANASVETASILTPGGPGWYGSGWYWDPMFGGYAFIPADGFFYGAFGFPFYSPYYVGYAGGWYGGGYGGYAHGLYGHGAYGHGVYGFRAGGSHVSAAPRFSGGGMHMGGGGMHMGGGGMHMGGGGMHMGGGGFGGHR